MSLLDMLIVIAQFKNLKHFYDNSTYVNVLIIENRCL